MENTLQLGGGRSLAISFFRRLFRLFVSKLGLSRVFVFYFSVFLGWWGPPRASDRLGCLQTCNSSWRLQGHWMEWLECKCSRKTVSRVKKKENIWQDFLNKINRVLITQTSCITNHQVILDLEPQFELEEKKKPDMLKWTKNKREIRYGSHTSKL